ncbi:MAG: SDR family NAD(P)-dependent oxidoreductase [Verrucomicrobiota bacterium JB022]|nr:SDR family NAD(P)-dependent oxidoreductase [Verrucomicrobiota bacterium JB022]
MADKKDNNRVALITGAGEGLGRATALRLARDGVKVGCLGRHLDNTQETVDLIKEAGGEAKALQADISKWEDMQKAAKQLDELWGRIDIVFANAGINGTWTPIADMEPEEWCKTIDINLTGTFYTVKACLPMLKRDGGSVIITSSVNGTRMFTNTGASAYSSSKAGQVAFMKMIALELASHRIRVNAICPGAIESAIDDNTDKENIESEAEPVVFPEGKIPLTDGKPGKAEDVAELVYFLASEHSRHITGTEVFIDGAQSLLQG